MSYEERLISEYRDLEEKHNKLHKMLVKIDAGKFEYPLACPVEMLREQAHVMGRYLYILETRALVEGIDLFANETHGR